MASLTGSMTFEAIIDEHSIISSIVSTTAVQKKEDRRASTIPCTIGLYDFTRALCENGSTINLMPLVIYKKARLGMLESTSMRLQVTDWSVKRPVGIVNDMLVRVGKFLLFTDFVIFDCAVDKEILIIMERHSFPPK